MSKISTTDGKVYSFIDMCDCELTGGCYKCNPFKEFWEEDIQMAEEGMGEYNKILLEEDKKK